MATELHSPLDLPCGAALRNRLAKAAMSEQLASRGAPDDRLVRLYGRWAAGGSGLLITGNVMIDRRHLGEAGNVVVEDDRDLEALSRWASAATAHQTHAWMQINHPGRQAPRNLDPEPVAPSAVPLRVAGAFAPPRALTEADIQDIVERFATTAAIAERAGFTGVEVHGAHGYLVSQFLSPLTNLRTDGWGGTPERRRRFLLEVVRAIRGVVAPGFAVSVKLNSADFQRGGFTETESLDAIAALGDEAVDLLEISGGTYERAEMFDGSSSESSREREAFFLDFAAKAREVAQMPLMVTGGFRSRAGMEQALASGAVDVVGMARPLAVEPDLPSRLLSGRAERARSIRLSTGLKAIDGPLNSIWYQQQIRRMARGLEPSTRMSRVGALLRYATDAVRQARDAT